MDDNQEKISLETKPDLLEKLGKKTYLIILIFIILVGYFILNRGYLYKGYIKQNDTTLESGWKTYENTVLGIKFSYPESWGEPVTDPEYLTNIESYIEDHKGAFSSHFIQINFKNNKDVSIMLFDDFLSKQDLSSDVCSYQPSSRRYLSVGIINELNSECVNGIKRSFIENKQYFDFTDPKTLYSYYLDYFAYSQAGNSVFKNALVKYNVKTVTQQKTPTSFDLFIKDNNLSDDVHKLGKDEFDRFVKSVKAAPTSEKIKAKTNILAEDSVDIKLVKTYYNLLAENSFESAFYLLSKPVLPLEDYTLMQKNIYDLVIKEINQIGGSKVEVYVQIQGKNERPKIHRQIFDIRDGKLDLSMDESINGEISTFNGEKTYASTRDSGNYVILLKNSTDEVVVKNINSSRESFAWATFSPKGRYIEYETQYYESSGVGIYDTLKEKIVSENITPGFFNKEETMYFVCSGPSAMNGDAYAIIYSLPDFVVKTDLYKLDPSLINSSLECHYDKDLNIQTYEFSEFDYYKNDGKGQKNIIKVYKFDAKTGDLISQ